MGDQNIHFCFEAKDDQGKPVYMIYTSKLCDLESDSPRFTTDVITCGVPSMGCGLFGSKLVLAGGSVGSDHHGIPMKLKGVITYDTTTRKLSHSDIPEMGGGKLCPLLFQLDNKLYALDTAYYPDPSLGSFELYVPKKDCWMQLQLDYYSWGKYCAGRLADPGSMGISFFSWYTFGSIVFVSLPKDSRSHCNFANIVHQNFLPRPNPLPFPGMAITYSQPEFGDDVVLISFSKGGLVEGRLLRRPFIFHGKPVTIFDTKTYSPHVGDLNGWFAGFGCGTFCLTAFDNVDIYVHVFKISRGKCRNGEDFKIKLLDHWMHRFKYSDFSEAGRSSFNFAGCFAQSTQSGGNASIFPSRSTQSGGRRRRRREGIEMKVFRSWFSPYGIYEEEEDDVWDAECSTRSRQ